MDLQVLQVFPRLVDLPAERFQAALARILQVPSLDLMASTYQAKRILCNAHNTTWPSFWLILTSSLPCN